VVAAQVEQPVVGQLAEPEAEGQPGSLQIAGQPPHRLELRLLYHVVRAQPGPQPRVEAQLDEALQVGPMPGQQPAQGLRVARPGLVEQPPRLLRVGLRRVHAPLLPY
jgi:hypothetical protein